MSVVSADQGVLSVGFSSNGFSVKTAIVDAPAMRRSVEALMPAMSAGAKRATGYNRRNILSIAEVRGLAQSNALRAIVEPILGAGAFPVRGILFDKVALPGATANWSVGWHQDCAIAVKARPAHDVPGFGPWSVKAGVVHVEPPVQVLEHMVTLRVHLDDCDESNGPLKVIAGSHAHGKLSEDEVKRWVSTGEAVTCWAKAGDVLVMRPLLLHASSRVIAEGARGEAAAAGRRRRVIHIEYAANDLPGRLQWAERS